MNKKMIFIPFFFVGMAALVIWVVMLLWNWLMPMLFDLSCITFWEAAGILLLSKILFGGFGGSKHKCHCQQNRTGGWKDKFKHKWGHLSDEDKQKWEAKFAKKMGCDSPAESSPNEPAP